MLSEADKKTLAKLSPDLQYILAERGVSLEVQLKLGEIGFVTIGLTASLADDRSSLRDILNTDFDLDPTAAGLTAEDKLKRRVEVARMIDSWEACKTRQEKESELAAEQRASRLPLTIGKNTHVQLRQRFEREYGAKKDRNWPAATMVERRFEEIDEGSLRAEPLTEIVSTEEAQEDPFGAILDKDGAIRLKKAAKKVDLPPDSEQLRIRLKILSTSFMLARYQHSTRPWLQTCTPGIWLEHVDYVLGPEVYGYSITIEGVKVSPSWSVALAYEFQLRKKAVREVMYNGMDIAKALEIARKCSETKEQ